MPLMLKICVYFTLLKSVYYHYRFEEHPERVKIWMRQEYHLNLVIQKLSLPKGKRRFAIVHPAKNHRLRSMNVEVLQVKHYLY